LIPTNNQTEQNGSHSKKEIEDAEKELREAKDSGLPVDNPGVVALQNYLAALRSQELN
jgi:hypothetical protein